MQSNQEVATLIRSVISRQLYESYLNYVLSDDKSAAVESSDLFEKAFVKFFDLLSKVGIISRCELEGSYRTSFMRSWNALADNLSEDDDKRLMASLNVARKFIGVLMFRIMIQDAKKTIFTYDEMVNFVASGNLDEKFPSAHTCHETGKSIHTFIKDWGLVHCEWTVNGPNFSDGGQFTLLPQIVEEDSVQHVTINFPTGRVVFGDMIRIDPVMNLYKQYAFKSANTSVKSICETTRILASHQILHTVSGNTCPRIYTADGAVTVGRATDEENDSSGDFKTDDSYVCTDLWGVTMIDEGILIDLLSETMAKDEAKSIVEQYLKKHGADGQGVIEIEPGEYNLYFHGNQHRLHTKFQTDDIDFGEIEYQFLLSKRPITFTLKSDTKKIKYSI